jgi:hypothetical protein
MGPLSNPFLEVLLLFIAPGTITSSSHVETKPRTWSKKGGDSKKNKK